MMSARVARAGLRATTQQFAVPRTAALNGLRTYATPAQEVKPPVSLFGVDGTYATALVCKTPVVFGAYSSLVPVRRVFHPLRYPGSEREGV